ncbi:MAG: hypothetical protein IKA44_02955 [Clostridia bacterium]|nr:hypothetical protein [Clostridia bacterium]
MKRTLVLLLTLTLLFSTLAVLSSCNKHECTFATEWSHDDTNHWRACVGEDCVEISEKASHTWNDGEITTKATQEADGVKTYTCSVCSHTKTESVSFAGMTKDEWNLIIHPNNFKNYTLDMKMLIVTPSIDAQFNSSLIFKFTEDATYMYAQSAGQTSEDTYESSSMDLAADIVAMFDYDNFTYDAEAKLYRAKGKISIPWDDSEPTDATIRFENGKLVEMKYSYTTKDEDSGLDMDFDNTVKFTDYGTTVIPNL